jgi:hypothetical protein
VVISSRCADADCTRDREFGSTTFLDQIEHVTSGDATQVTKYQRVISYGVALMLDRVAEWLDDHAPDERGGNTGAT